MGKRIKRDPGPVYIFRHYKPVETGRAFRRRRGFKACEKGLVQVVRTTRKTDLSGLRCCRNFKKLQGKQWGDYILGTNENAVQDGVLRVLELIKQCANSLNIRFHEDCCNKPIEWGEKIDLLRVAENKVATRATAVSPFELKLNLRGEQADEALGQLLERVNLIFVEQLDREFLVGLCGGLCESGILGVEVYNFQRGLIVREDTKDTFCVRT